jgi:hypothetical protein
VERRRMDRVYRLSYYESINYGLFI